MRCQTKCQKRAKWKVQEGTMRKEWKAFVKMTPRDWTMTERRCKHKYFLGANGYGNFQRGFNENIWKNSYVRKAFVKTEDKEKEEWTKKLLMLLSKTILSRGLERKTLKWLKWRRRRWSHCLKTKFLTLVFLSIVASRENVDHEKLERSTMGNQQVVQGRKNLPVKRHNKQFVCGTRFCGQTRMWR